MSQTDVRETSGDGGRGCDRRGRERAHAARRAAFPLVSRHTFPQLSSFSADQMRQAARLRLRGPLLASLAARFSGYLRMECTVQLSKLETVRYQQFTNRTGHSDASDFVSNWNRWRGSGMLDMPPRLALVVVDREMGGPAVCEDVNPATLTEIEVKLSGQGGERSSWQSGAKPGRTRSSQLRGVPLRTGKLRALSANLLRGLDLVEPGDGNKNRAVGGAGANRGPPIRARTCTIHKLSSDLQSVEKSAAGPRRAGKCAGTRR